MLSSHSKNSISEMTNGSEYVSPVRSPEMIGNRKGFRVGGSSNLLLSSRSKNSISEMTNGSEYVSPVRSPEMIGNRKGFGVGGTWLQLMCCAVSHRRVPNFESQGFDRR